MKKFQLNQIVPTEDDNFFRNFQIHGVVHDEGAAMMNGVSANAGLFSTGSDLSKFYQIFLDGDIENEDQVIDNKVVKLFTNMKMKTKNFIEA